MCFRSRNKIPGEELNEVEIDDLSEKEFRVMILKMIKELGSRIDAQSEKLEVFSKQLENTKNNPADEVYNN